MSRRESSRRARPHPRPGLPEPRIVEGPAGRLALLEAGEGGLPVLLVHGLAGSALQWRHQLLHLSIRRRAAALDLRGHGASDRAGEGTYDVDAFAEDVGAAADALELERFVLAGHSLGGLVACRYAAGHPHRVAGLLLADPNGDQSRLPPDQVEAFLAAVRADPGGEMRFNFRQVLAGAAPEVLEGLAATAPEVLVGALESAARVSPAADLERYGGPALSVISPFNSLPISLHNLVPGLSVRRLRGTSHWLMLDQPEELNRLLDAFLRRVEP